MSSQQLYRHPSNVCWIHRSVILSRRCGALTIKWFAFMSERRKCDTSNVMYFICLKINALRALRASSLLCKYSVPHVVLYRKRMSSTFWRQSAIHRAIWPFVVGCSFPQNIQGFRRECIGQSGPLLSGFNLWAGLFAILKRMYHNSVLYCNVSFFIFGS